ncbi:hypothetical protein C7S20_05715 [Christiangramia fulva]|uniref:DUF1259 domain-containing protein n=1 Tax=Christiangramia fulva TaxID=2126553 RepID=A0A2R3Z3G8_9FLAO|nr:DUF1259 domain-containing protein [Christiangramia fulva]AVR44805.1 hypothetical protein C7S20_05715 [Christiangramia fulva]
MRPIYLLLFCFFLFSCLEPANTENENEPEPTQTLDKHPDLKELDITLLKDSLGMDGTENNGEFKITIPQNDLNVSVDGFKIIPPMGLGSWVAFTPTGDKPMIMGDIVVTEKDLKPVQQEVIKQGLTVTAIHNHFVRNEPDVMYMHIGGMGTEEELAAKVKSVLDVVEKSRGANPSEFPAGKVENTLNTRMIDSILGHKGSMNNGVYKIVIGRPDVDLKENGTGISTFMGFNTWASWQGTPEKAAVAGDFTMLEDEVAPVIKALIENDIEVVALHNHMVKEEPRIFFLHYWGVGPAEKLAKGLKETLGQTGSSGKN